MTTAFEDPEPLSPALVAFVRDEMERLHVPGVSVGVYHAGRVIAQGFGVTNVDHPSAVDEHTPFQIGSTSKTFTATVLMQEVEAGRIDFEARIRDYLPDFALQSEEDAERITLRHLVTHHGGWSGDYFRDAGRGDDALAKHVAKMRNSPQIVEAGRAFSYNNAGYYVLGRMLEVVTGRGYEELITDRIFRPLRMRRSFYFAEDVINLGPAAGHHYREDDGPAVAMPYHMSRGTMPGGGIISTAVDQARYIALHADIDDGRSGDQALLHPDTLRLMQTPHAEAGSMCDQVGISWMLDDLETAQPTVKHGGATNGHLSSFELVPSERFGVTVLTNCDTGRELRDTVAAAVRDELIGPRPPVERGSWTPDDPGEYAGVYRVTLAEPHVTVREGQVYVEARTPERILSARPLSSPGDPPVRIQFYAPDRAVIVEPPRTGERCEFVRDESGQIEYLRWDGRLSLRDGAHS